MARKSEFLAKNIIVLSQIISNEEDKGSFNTLKLKTKFETLSELVDEAERTSAKIVTISGEKDETIPLSKAKTMKARIKATIQIKINQFLRSQKNQEEEATLQAASA